MYCCIIQGKEKIEFINQKMTLALHSFLIVSLPDQLYLSYLFLKMLFLHHRFSILCTNSPNYECLQSRCFKCLHDLQSHYESVFGWLLSPFRIICHFYPVCLTTVFVHFCFCYIVFFMISYKVLNEQSLKEPNRTLCKGLFI